MIDVSKLKKFAPKPPLPMPDKIIVNIQIQLDTESFRHDGVEQHEVSDWINDEVIVSTSEHLGKKDSIEFEVYEIPSDKVAKKSKKRK